MSQSRLPGTPSLLRAINDRAALELLLERGPLTRAQLGELTGLSKVTASQLVERLEERQLVARVGELAGGRGPNAQLYAVVPSSAYVVGVEVGPRQVVAASADITGRTTGRVEVSTHDADDPVGSRARRRDRGGATGPAPHGSGYGGSCSAPRASSTRPRATSRSRSTCPTGTTACSARCGPTWTGRWRSRTT